MYACIWMSMCVCVCARLRKQSEATEWDRSKHRTRSPGWWIWLLLILYGDALCISTALALYSGALRAKYFQWHSQRLYLMVFVCLVERKFIVVDVIVNISHTVVFAHRSLDLIWSHVCYFPLFRFLFGFVCSQNKAKKNNEHTISKKRKKSHTHFPNFEFSFGCSVSFRFDRHLNV